jgi:hypothetical protein
MSNVAKSEQAPAIRSTPEFAKFSAMLKKVLANPPKKSPKPVKA